MKCEDCQAAISCFVDDELDDSSTVEMLRHLSDCSGCRTNLRETRSLQLSMRFRPLPELPMQLDTRIRHSVREIGRRPPFWSRIQTLSDSKIPLRFSIAATVLVLLLTGWTVAAVTLFSGSRSDIEMPPQILTLPAVEAHGLHVSKDNNTQNEG